VKLHRARLRRRDIFLITVTTIFLLGKGDLFNALAPNIHSDIELELSYLLDIVFTIWLGRRYAPEMFQYFRLPERSRASLIALAMSIFILTAQVPFLQMHYKNLPHILNGLLWLFILGMGEEIACRGFIFNLFRRHGIQRAAWYSSIIFGLLHFNHIFDGASKVGTTFQVINAIAYGYFMVGLMIATKSIWPSIFMHALNDFPYAFGVGFVLPNSIHDVSWLMELTGPVAMVGLGWGLLRKTKRTR
jgi:membrane protease YdiL (CAAX protease family)